ncbi:MFS transporter [Acidiphilium sp. AL]|uniref:MFS transporter n=1 Tax=Acidiphilium iwatense TaxID=768198 RepID=A0ABS9DV16_9PROT|nr:MULTISPECIES: MFS transporter [Acidiphilium]MCF3945551.1 MFS transporter [Acidiphilium iwatense]MCU4159644.1 MFS transporter [Acidiphilium sp. AL]
MSERVDPMAEPDVAVARKVVVAAFLGWTLDAFDFFILIFTFSAVAKTFHVGITAVTVAVTLTLAMRAVGALIFGRLADRFGRRPMLMVNILAFSVLELATGFAPTLTAFMILRALYGIAMGGEWGLGSSLTMETIPVRWRGWVSGLLQSGYPAGYFLATVLFGLAFPYVGWRGMFMIGALPALLVLYIRSSVPESPVWREMAKQPRVPVSTVLRKHLGLTIYAVILMMAFNFFSHGSQDLYPNVFLGVQHHFSHATITTIALIYNAGAIIGGIAFGALSQRIGRRLTIGIAAGLALPLIPLWAFSSTPLMLGLGAFLMQICVQGAWGIIPVHLNELSPKEIRATFPGFVYQLGNFLASYNATLQASFAASHNHNYGLAMALVVGIVAAIIVVLMIFGREAKDISMAHS